jgi:hypothetical protein
MSLLYARCAAILLALPITLAGCRSNPACSPDAEYRQAIDRPRLELPGTLSQSERMVPLVIPPMQAEVGKLDPPPTCLDEPPPFYARKATGAAPSVAGDTAESVVETWNAAWSERRAPAVMQLYSPSFQPPGVAGSAEFLDQRREQIATGPAPAPKLEDVQVTAQTSDRRTVTFVQRFGSERLRKELILVREGGNWRIVSEQVLETL